MTRQHLSLWLALATLLTGMFIGKALANEQEPIWIDVRSAAEYAEGHLVGTVHIPHDEIGERISSVTTDKERPIHLFCQSGRRAAIAVDTLQQLGYTNLHNEGSFENAVAARPDLRQDCSNC